MVSFEEMDAWGRANLEEGRILLNEKIPQNIPLKICLFGGCTFRPKYHVRLREGEQYFLTLLHEIGHFKIKVSAPKEFYFYKRQLAHELDEYEAANLWEKIKKKESASFVFELVDMKKRPYESWHDLKNRKIEFLSWLFGTYNRQHRRLHTWAIGEFLRQRTTIDYMLYE